MTTAGQRESLIFIISGPSGSGKSTLVEKILQMPGVMLSVSCTTREPRTSESAGKWYNFVSEERFQEMMKNGEFLEYARVFGKNWYGTPLKNWQEAQGKHLDLILEIDVQGAQKVQEGPLAERVASIFILPPSAKELERRLRSRAMDSEDEIERRLKQATTEIKAYAGNYDYRVINDNVECAAREIEGILLEERKRPLEERRAQMRGSDAVAAASRRRSDAQIKLRQIGF